MPREVAPPPPWLDEATLRSLRMTDDADPRAAAAMRDALWGRYPALPLPAIEEAARLLMPPRIGAATPTRRGRILFARLARIAARFRPT